MSASGFINGDWHAWQAHGCILLSDEIAKHLTSWRTWEDCTNYLWFHDRQAARSLDAWVKANIVPPTPTDTGFSPME